MDMSRYTCLAALVLAAGLAASEARAQRGAYIGFAYPAGGQQGTAVQVRLGGQRLTGLYGVSVSGEGVQAKVVKFFGRISNQDRRLMLEQLKELQRKSTKKTQATRELMARIQERIASYVNRPACASLQELAFVEVKIDKNATPGPREIRLVTTRGVTNPVPFHIGQVPEVARKPMKTCPTQVLGKEYLAMRKRPPEEEEARVTIPCTMNGQIASGEVNRYRFQARKGQRLVITTAARQLVPYIADAVPGWFQPVLTLRDAAGREVAYNDDFRFKPDPTILFEVPRDGEYVLTMADAIYRGREDFVYRITIGEMPFVTSIFPLGGKAGSATKVKMEGWNLQKTRLTVPPKSAAPGVYHLSAKGRNIASNLVPFALDTLPECVDAEPNNTTAQAQKVALGTIVNGRSDCPGDCDVFSFRGKAGQMIVAEVLARRLDSPLDSMLALTDAQGKVLALNDDYEDPGVGLNTHHADSYLMAELPADGTYYVHLSETCRKGGPAYAYRLRISTPRPDFALRVVPSGVGFRSRSYGSTYVYAIRKDGFDGPIKLGLSKSTKGFTGSPVTLAAKTEKVRYGIRTTLKQTRLPISLEIEGRATINGKEIVRTAVGADDQMQAFLWRHLVPAQECSALVYSGSYQLHPARKPPPGVGDPTKISVKAPSKKPSKPPAKPTGKTPAKTAEFTRQQVLGRLRQLKRLYDEYLITESFYKRKVDECVANL